MVGEIWDGPAGLWMEDRVNTLQLTHHECPPPSHAWELWKYALAHYKSILSTPCILEQLPRIYLSLGL
jgi:hypothetical protein